MHHTELQGYCSVVFAISLNAEASSLSTKEKVGPKPHTGRHQKEYPELSREANANKPLLIREHPKAQAVGDMLGCRILACLGTAKK
jgi:hypothetical protein